MHGVEDTVDPEIPFNYNLGLVVWGIEKTAVTLINVRPSESTKDVVACVGFRLDSFYVTDRLSLAAVREKRKNEGWGGGSRNRKRGKQRGKG